MKAYVLLALLALCIVLAGCGGSVAPSASNPEASAAAEPTVDTQSLPVVVLQAVADATLNQNHPSTNYGSTITLPVGFNTNNTLYRSLVRFDLSSIPANATINKATLSLYQVGSSGVPLAIRVYRSTKTWSEGTVTWNSNGTSFNSTAITSGGGGASNQSWVAFNVLPVVRSWYIAPSRNFGLMLRGSSEGGDWSFHSYASKESGPIARKIVRPRLRIEYTL